MEPRRTLSPRYVWVSAMLLLVIAAGLVSQWPTRSLWYDETVNAYLAESSWGTIWEWCTEIDNQVPLGFFLLKLWGAALGTSEFALRAFSFACGLLTLAGVMALGRRLGGQWAAGWLAAGALVLSQGYLYAVFEVRVYALALALAVGASNVFWAFWRRAELSDELDGRAWRWLGGYWALAIALVYAHYTGYLVIGVHAAYALWRTVAARSRRRARLMALVFGGVAAGYLPWITALAGRDVRAGTAYAGRVLPDTALRTYTDFFAYGQHIAPDGRPHYALAILVVVAAGALAWAWHARSDREARGRLLFAGLLTALPVIGLTVMVYAVQAKLSGRHGWASWVGAALLIGAGLAMLGRGRWWRWPLWIGALGIVWLPVTATLQPQYNSYLREAFAYVEAQAQPGDVLVLRDGTLFTAAEYYDTPLPWVGLPPDKLTDVERFLFFPEAAATLQALIEDHQARRVWVIAWQGHIMDPQDLTAGLLEYAGEGEPLPGSFGFGDVSVARYRLDGASRLEALADEIALFEASPVGQSPLNGPVFLGGYVLADGPVRRGDWIVVHTWWQRGAAVVPDMRASLRLYVPGGTEQDFFGLGDQPPAGPSFGQENWLPGVPILSRSVIQVPYDAAAGSLDMKMVLYVLGEADTVTVPVTTITVAE